MASSKPAQTDPRVKKLKIQTGVVKRLTKDKIAYEKEIVEVQEKIEKLGKQGMSRFLVDKQEEVLNETQRMIPEVLGRLNTACTELEALLEGGSDLGETEDYKTAQTVLESGKTVLAEGTQETS